MNEDRLTVRLATLSDYDRYVAQAQMARAEAIADAVLAVTGWIRKQWKALRASAHAYNARQWPHPQALR